MGRRNAAYTLGEAMELAEQSHLTGWPVTAGLIWLTVPEGYLNTLASFQGK